MSSYQCPKSTQQFEFEIKRSRFITSISFVESKRDAKSFIKKTRAEYPDANHNCWAMIAGIPEDVYQQDQSDDGEPKGTAGRPMLNVLQHSGLGNIVVVVTRYFGGIKLGAGGLVRAYTQCVSEALKNLETSQCHIREEINIKLPYSLLDSLEHSLKETLTTITNKTFTDSVQLTLNVPSKEKEDLILKMNELGQGKIIVFDES